MFEFFKCLLLDYLMIWTTEGYKVVDAGVYYWAFGENLFEDYVEPEEHYWVLGGLVD